MRFSPGTLRRRFKNASRKPQQSRQKGNRIVTICGALALTLTRARVGEERTKYERRPRAEISTWSDAPYFHRGTVAGNLESANRPRRVLAPFTAWKASSNSATTGQTRCAQRRRHIFVIDAQGDGKRFKEEPKREPKRCGMCSAKTIRRHETSHPLRLTRPPGVFAGGFLLHLSIAATDPPSILTEGIQRRRNQPIPGSSLCLAEV